MKIKENNTETPNRCAFREFFHCFYSNFAGKAKHFEIHPIFTLVSKIQRKPNNLGHFKWIAELTKIVENQLALLISGQLKKYGTIIA